MQELSWPTGNYFNLIFVDTGTLCSLFVHKASPSIPCQYSALFSHMKKATVKPMKSHFLLEFYSTI